MSALRRLLVAPRPARSPGGRATDDRPRTSVRTGPTAPAVVLRLGLLGLCLGAGATVAEGTTQWWLVLAVGVAVALQPHAALLAVAAALVTGMLALSGQHWWQLPVLVLLTHALLRLGAVADAVSWRGRVELAVLRDALPGFVAVQLVGQAAACLALLLDGAAPVPWFVVGGVGALAALLWLVVRELRAARR